MSADPPPTAEPDLDADLARLRAGIQRLERDPSEQARVAEWIEALDEEVADYRAGVDALDAGRLDEAEDRLRRAATRGHPEAAYDLAVTLLRRVASTRGTVDPAGAGALAGEAATWLLEADARGVLAPEDTGTEERRLLVVDLWLKVRILDDPSGWEWEVLRDRLTRYAYPILMRWIAAGVIRRRAAVANHGGPVLGLGRVPENLRLFGDDAAELAADIVMSALRAFPSKALPIWDPTRGKGLRSYFVGFCLMKLPDAYRGWYRREVASRPGTLSYEETADLAGTGVGPDDIVAMRDELDRLSDKDPLVRVIARMKGAGYTHTEIAEKLQAEGISITGPRVGRLWKKVVHHARTHAPDPDR